MNSIEKKTMNPYLQFLGSHKSPATQVYVYHSISCGISEPSMAQSVIFCINCHGNKRYWIRIYFLMFLDRQTIMFSATWAPKVQALVREFLNDPIQVIFVWTLLLLRLMVGVQHQINVIFFRF